MFELIWPMIVAILFMIGMNKIILKIVKRVAPEARIIHKPDNVFVDFIDAVVLASIIEEAIFRGPIYLIFKGEFSLLAWTGILISACLFGFFHYLILYFVSVRHFKEINKKGRICLAINAFWVGIILGWLVITTNSLILAIIVHGSYNFYVFRNHFLKPLL